MKKLFVLLLATIVVVAANAQGITGKWKTADIKENHLQSVRRTTMAFNGDGSCEMQAAGERPQKGTEKQAGKNIAGALR